MADKVRVHYRITEGSKSRIQIFEGLVIAISNGGPRTTFTVHKESFGVGVERVFAYHSKLIDKIEIVSGGMVRRARLYYLRNLSGKAARIKSRRLKSGELMATADDSTKEAKPKKRKKAKK